MLGTVRDRHISRTPPAPYFWIPIGIIEPDAGLF
jgi:hypothetical protein